MKSTLPPNPSQPFHFGAPHPADAALRALAIDAASAVQPISLLSWKRSRIELKYVDDSVWLATAYQKMKAAGFKLVFLETPNSDPFPLNDEFYDIEVHRGGAA
jgi:hypothetical protein